MLTSPWPSPALLELLLPAVAQIASATYAATGGDWPRSSALRLTPASGPATLDQLRLEACACPSDSAAARAWHQLVRRDAETDRPLTPHGRAVRGSGRPWPGLGHLGDCLCRSSLVFHEEPDTDADAADAA